MFAREMARQKAAAILHGHDPNLSYEELGVRWLRYQDPLRQFHEAIGRGLRLRPVEERCQKLTECRKILGRGR